MCENTDDIFRSQLDNSKRRVWIDILNMQVDITISHERWIYTSEWWERAENIVDAGCGTGYYANILSSFSSNKHIVGVDLQEGLIAEAVKSNSIKSGSTRLEFKVGNYDSTGETNNDVIIARLLLQHLVDVTSFLDWASLSLRKGGRLIIVEPIDNEEYYFPKLDFYWEFRKRLRDAEKQAKGDRGIQERLSGLLKNNSFFVEENRKITIPSIGPVKDYMYKARSLIPQLQIVPMTEEEEAKYQKELIDWYNNTASYSHITVRVLIAKKI
jgi:SAM-dependent methyltransferase